MFAGCSIFRESRPEFEPELGPAIGAVNIFDEYIDKVGPPYANRLSVGLEYPRRSAANYEGGQWYLRGTYSWYLFS